MLGALTRIGHRAGASTGFFLAKSRCRGDEPLVVDRVAIPMAQVLEGELLDPWVQESIYCFGDDSGQPAILAMAFVRAV
jgi:hypothetical protein